MADRQTDVQTDRKYDETDNKNILRKVNLFRDAKWKKMKIITNRKMIEAT
jgi:hypothetical protein